MRRLSADAPAKPVHFSHFVLRVRNLEASLAWYELALGMQAVHRGEKIVFLTYDREHHRLALVQTPVAAAAPGAPGLDHVAYTLADLGALLGNYRRLKRAGVAPVWPVHHGFTVSLYYADPDGNRVEFQVERFKTEAELKGYMQSPEFAANPVGQTFDPEKLAARFEAGDAVEELMLPGAA